jgi:RHS repeat-associated protein
VAVWNVSVDHLNRPVLMTNSLKVAMWTAVWQPWGGAHSITGTATLDTRFPGQWYQSETGLHYNWHRSYDPTVGRYTQPDPLGFVDGPSVYGYAKGRPHMAVDKDGRAVVDFWVEPAIIGGLIIAGTTYVWNKYCAPLILEMAGKYSPASYRDCTMDEMKVCTAQCGTKGVQSCQVGRRLKPTGTRNGKIGYALKDFPVSCSCNE